MIGFRGSSAVALRACAGAALFWLQSLSRPLAAQVPVVEQHRTNLGGPSGHYTDWGRSGIEGFAGLRVTVEIQRTHGRPRDPWSALARINLSDVATGGAERPMLSLRLIADRRTDRISAVVVPVGGGERLRLAFEGAVGQPVDVEFRMTGNSALGLRVGDSRHSLELPPGFRVDTVTAVGSGVDVRFDPFELLLDR